ncbi:MAG: glyoxalase superfamily protein [Pseudomonadota bacterium]
MALHTTGLTIAGLKSDAKTLRTDMAARGVALSQSEALETVAHQHGARDWNTLSAQVKSATPAAPVQVGQKVRGTYLGQAFTGEVLGLSTLVKGDSYRVTVKFDTALDVVTFDSFSSFRSRITARINGKGVSLSKLSDGTPHLVLEG